MSVYVSCIVAASTKASHGMLIPRQPMWEDDMSHHGRGGQYFYFCPGHPMPCMGGGIYEGIEAGSPSSGSSSSLAGLQGYGRANPI